MSASWKAIRAVGPLLVAALELGSAAAAPARTPNDLKSNCLSFAAKAALPRGKLRIEFAPAANGAPASCVVHGILSSAPSSVIHFRLDLPDPSFWNKRLLSIGGGGFDGSVDSEQPGFRQFLGIISWPHDFSRYAIFATDSGHQGLGNEPYLDFSWALHDPTALLDYAYRANHLVLQASISLARQFYGRPPKWRYKIGVSNGGRQGLAAAARYPTDYNGIVAMAPAISQAAIAANAVPLLQYIYSSPDHWLNPPEIQLLQSAETAACDSLDGLHRRHRRVSLPAGCPSVQERGDATLLPHARASSGSEHDPCQQGCGNQNGGWLRRLPRLGHRCRGLGLAEVSFRDLLRGA